jgi:hypothetical protein
MQRVYKDIRHAPVTVDLQEGPMGLVGKPQIVKKHTYEAAEIAAATSSIPIPYIRPHER